MSDNLENSFLQLKLHAMLAVVSVVLLYLETSLQLFVVMTSHALPVSQVPVALTILTMTFISFLVTTLISIVLTLQLTTFRQKLTSRLVFSTLHACGMGLLWRAFKLVLAFSESDLKHLNFLHMVHVGLQSSVYVTLYIRFFTIGSKINFIQALSLLVSTVSSSLALTSFNLGNNFSLYSDEEAHTVENSPSHLYIRLAVASVGTTLVYGVRLISIALMASQQGLWTLLPLVFHFLVMALIYGFKRSKARDFQYRTICLHILHSAGMAWLNVLDLAQDHKPSMKCTYVGFGSLHLVENIVMLSFWMFESSLGSMSKLFMVTGILAVFIVGLIAKFMAYDACNDKHYKLYKPQTNHLYSVSYCNICTTVVTSPNRAINQTPNQICRGNPYCANGHGDDLISIIQTARSKNDNSGVLHINLKSELDTSATDSPSTHQYLDDGSLHGDICPTIRSYNKAQDLSQSQTDLKVNYQMLKSFHSRDNVICSNNKRSDQRYADLSLSSHHSQDQNITHNRRMNHSEDMRVRQVSEILLDPGKINHPEWDTELRAASSFLNPTLQDLACKHHHRGPMYIKDSNGHLCAPRFHPNRLHDSSEPRSRRTQPQYSVDSPLWPSKFQMAQAMETSSWKMPYSEFTQSSLSETQTDNDDVRDSRTSSTFTSSPTTTIQPNRYLSPRKPLSESPQPISASERVIQWLSNTAAAETQMRETTKVHGHTSSSQSSVIF
ncbi:hypothetical protein EGW08_005265 [Elysia chlorotica]|uniref:XK-related protein n=1 Tax=Elysia chlorotica TaxID=188477 RepID=A0A3S1BMA6_ELYCH|nr:hypothetical protein EGW08_005265 [Elysia chlorotica]